MHFNSSTQLGQQPRLSTGLSAQEALASLLGRAVQGRPESEVKPDNRGDMLPRLKDVTAGRELGGHPRQNGEATDAHPHIYETGTVLTGDTAGATVGTGGPLPDDRHCKKRRYFKVDPEKRNKLIMWTVTDQMTVKRAAATLKINYSTAKHIVKQYKDRHGSDLRALSQNFQGDSGMLHHTATDLHQATATELKSITPSLRNLSTPLQGNMFLNQSSVDVAPTAGDLAQQIRNITGSSLCNNTRQQVQQLSPALAYNTAGGAGGILSNLMDQQVNSKTSWPLESYTSLLRGPTTSAGHDQQRSAFSNVIPQQIGALNQKTSSALLKDDTPSNIVGDLPAELLQGSSSAAAIAKANSIAQQAVGYSQSAQPFKSRGSQGPSFLQEATSQNQHPSLSSLQVEKIDRSKSQLISEGGVRAGALLGQKRPLQTLLSATELLNSNLAKRPCLVPSNNLQGLPQATQEIKISQPPSQELSPHHNVPTASSIRPLFGNIEDLASKSLGRLGNKFTGLSSLKIDSIVEKPEAENGQPPKKQPGMIASQKSSACQLEVNSTRAGEAQVGLSLKNPGQQVNYPSAACPKENLPSDLENGHLGLIQNTPPISKEEILRSYLAKASSRISTPAAEVAEASASPNPDGIQAKIAKIQGLKAEHGIHNGGFSPSSCHRNTNKDSQKSLAQCKSGSKLPELPKLSDALLTSSTFLKAAAGQNEDLAQPSRTASDLSNELKLTKNYEPHAARDEDALLAGIADQNESCSVSEAGGHFLPKASEAPGRLQTPAKEVLAADPTHDWPLSPDGLLQSIHTYIEAQSQPQLPYAPSNPALGASKKTAFTPEQLEVLITHLSKGLCRAKDLLGKKIASPQEEESSSGINNGGLSAE